MPDVGTKGRLHVVVTCTDRKTRPIPADLRARVLPHDASLASRLDAWLATLDAPSTGDDVVPAARLYAGDHWHVVKSLAGHAPPDVTLRVWVCSAGYGLIDLATLLRPYAATFVARHADSVVPPGATYGPGEWWSGLGSWRPQGYDGPRSLAELAREMGPNDCMLVAVSGAYVAALSADLARAAAAVPDGDRLAVLSARYWRGAGTEAVRRNVIETEARLKTQLAGAMQSLNARIARRAVELAPAWFPSRDALDGLVRSWIAEAPEAEAYGRDQFDDDTIRAFIRAALAANPKTAKTPLLTAWRSGGRACEQTRFGGLFDEVRGEVGRESSDGGGEPSLFATASADVNEDHA